MSLRRAAAAALVAASTAGTARAVSINGTADVGYIRNDYWAQDSYARSSPFDFGARLGLGSASWDLATWNLAGTYRNVQTSTSFGDDHSASIGFQGNASLFPRTAVPIQLYALRQTLDFSSDLASGATGSSLATNLGGSATFRAQGLPTLQLRMQRSLLDTHSLTGFETTTRSTLAGGAFDWHLGRNSISLDYQAGWNGGSASDAAYRSNALSANLVSALTDTLVLRIYDRLYQRAPTSEAPFNPRYDDNAVDAALEWTPSQELWNRLAVQQHNDLFRAAGAPEVEIVSQTVSDQLNRRLSENAQGFLRATYAHGNQRRGDLSLESNAGSGGLGLLWRRTMGALSLGAAADGSAGAVEDVGDGTRAQWTAGGQGTVSWNTQSAVLSLAYGGSYGRNGATLHGFVVSQNAMASVDAPVGSALLRGSLTAWIQRRQDSIVGNARDRNLLAAFDLSRGDLHLHLDAALTDGSSIGPRLDPTALPPAAFNRTQAYATAWLSHRWGRWTLLELARTLTTTAPDRPRDSEHALGVRAAYTIGLLTLSAEERLALATTDGARRTVNYFFVRISRSFGGEL